MSRVTVTFNLERLDIETREEMSIHVKTLHEDIVDHLWENLQRRRVKINEQLLKEDFERIKGYLDAKTS